MAGAKKNRIKKINIFYCVLTIAIIIFFLFGVYVQFVDYTEYKQQLVQARKEQAQMIEKNRSLMKDISYQDTDAYIEKIARERLSLVKPNEIVFIDENK